MEKGDGEVVHINSRSKEYILNQVKALLERDDIVYFEGFHIVVVGSNSHKQSVLISELDYTNYLTLIGALQNEIVNISMYHLAKEEDDSGFES